jgi:hypothetical protein
MRRRRLVPVALLVLGLVASASLCLLVIVGGDSVRERFDKIQNAMPLNDVVHALGNGRMGNAIPLIQPAVTNDPESHNTLRQPIFYFDQEHFGKKEDLIKYSVAFVIVTNQGTILEQRHTIHVEFGNDDRVIDKSYIKPTPMERLKSAGYFIWRKLDL